MPWHVRAAQAAMTERLVGYSHPRDDSAPSKPRANPRTMMEKNGDGGDGADLGRQTRDQIRCRVPSIAEPLAMTRRSISRRYDVEDFDGRVEGGASGQCCRRVNFIMELWRLRGTLRRDGTEIGSHRPSMAGDVGSFRVKVAWNSKIVCASSTRG
jgi:hypothetical protein